MKPKLLFFDEKIAVINLIISVICSLLLFAYEFMQSNFPYADITILTQVAEKCFGIWGISAVVLLFSWAWVTDRMRKFSIKKRIRGIIVTANILNCFVLLLGGLTA